MQRMKEGESKRMRDRRGEQERKIEWNESSERVKEKYREEREKELECYGEGVLKREGERG